MKSFFSLPTRFKLSEKCSQVRIPPSQFIYIYHGSTLLVRSLTINPWSCFYFCPFHRSVSASITKCFHAEYFSYSPTRDLSIMFTKLINEFLWVLYHSKRVKVAKPWQSPSVYEDNGIKSFVYFFKTFLRIGWKMTFLERGSVNDVQNCELWHMVKS